MGIYDIPWRDHYCACGELADFPHLCQTNRTASQVLEKRNRTLHAKIDHYIRDTITNSHNEACQYSVTSNQFWKERGRQEALVHISNFITMLFQKGIT
ncbi:MAG: hypothetical protein WC476_12505 [Phycisphaerae bacterium]|jgi:hypothetical protein